MSSPLLVKISRDGKEIGTYEAKEAVRLLFLRDLKPTDFYWHEGMAEWLPLAELWVPPPPPPPPPSGICPPPPVISSPEATEEQKPETLFIRCSVVVIGIFTAASMLNLIVYVAIILDANWGLLGGHIVSLPVFSNRHWYVSILPFVWGVLLQLAWWTYLTFCYIFGKYDQVAEKYDELEWFEIMGGGVPNMFRFPIFPLSFMMLGAMVIGSIFWLAVGVLWIWHLIF